MEPKIHSEPAGSGKDEVCPRRSPSLLQLLLLSVAALLTHSADAFTTAGKPNSSESYFLTDTCADRRSLDWDGWGFAERPMDSVIVDDGVRVDFDLSDPFGIVTIQGVYPGIGGNSFVIVPNENTTTDTSSLLISFTRPVEQLTFDLSDIDLSGSSQDQFSLHAYTAGVRIALTPTHYVLGADVDYLGNNTFEGNQFHGADADRHRVYFGFEEALDSIRIVFRQSTSLADPGNHDFRIGDLSWCKLPNAAPFMNNGTAGNDSLFYSVTAGVAERFCITTLRDPDQDSVQLSNWTAISATGMLTLEAWPDTCFQYTSPATYDGTDLFSVEFCDRRDPALCDQFVVSVEVTPPLINTAPSILDSGGLAADTIWYITNRGETLDACLRIEDIDSDNTAISQLDLLSGEGQAAVIAGSDTCLTFSPSQAFIGLATFQAIACDDGSPSLCDTVVLALDVLPIAPTALDDTFQRIQGTIDTLAITSNDQNPDGSALEVTVLTGPARGQATVLSNGTLRYAPPLDYVGRDSLVYQLCDQGGVVSGPQCSQATVVIELLPPGSNTAPEIVDENGFPIDSMALETVDLLPIEVCLNVNDAQGDSLSIIVSNAGSITGTVVVQGDLCFQYTPDPGFEGIEVLDVSVCDNQEPALCDDVAVSIEVRSYEPPTANPDFAFFQEDEGGQIPVLENDVSPLGFPLATTISDDYPLQGTGAVVDDEIVYQPDTEFFGVDTVQYNACDSLNLPGSCASGDVVVYVGCRLRSDLIWQDFAVERVPSGQALRGENIEATLTVSGGEVAVAPSSAVGESLQWQKPPGEEASRLSVVFSSPVEQLCFAIAGMDVDSQYSDRLVVQGYTGGQEYALRSYDALMGENLSYESNTYSVTGVAGNDDLAGMIDLCFFVPLDSIVLQFDNGLPGNDGADQSVTLGDLSWCQSDAELPEEPTTSTEFLASEGFSPNGDGILDYWVVEGIENVPQNHVQVFNMWGDMVYEARNYDNLDTRWDGRSNRRGAIGGAVLPDGVYLYVIRLSTGDSMKGHVVLKK